MAQVKNEEEKKRETTKKAVKKNTTNKVTKKTVAPKKSDAEEKKTTSKVPTDVTAKKQTATKKSASKSKNIKPAKDSKAVNKKVVANSEKIKKAEETKTKKESKARSTKKTSAAKDDTKKKNATTKTDKASKTKSTKSSKNSKKNNGKITKIIGSKKPEETVEDEDDVIITDANENNTDVAKIDDEEKLQLVENELKKDLKSKSKLPKEEEKKLSSVVFENLCVAIAVMIYLFFIILGFINIKEEVYNVDLKVFSFIILVIAILLFERAYKKDSGKLCAFGIETLFLSITTMGLLYVNIELQHMFLSIAAIISLLFAIYYVAKSIYLYSKMKKKYFVDNMKDIMQKEEKE